MVKKQVAPKTLFNQTVGLAPPEGMRDLLPPDAAIRAQLRRRIQDIFALYGYEQVTTPVFELAEVIERGRGALDPRDLLRFVEPQTGEVAMLRPDITPQIARIVATSLAHKPAPYRLSYEGTVIRQRHGRARRQKQIWQSGIELIGLAGPDADVEVIQMTVNALKDVGLHDFRIELAHVAIAKAALSSLDSHVREQATTALEQKDVYLLEQILHDAKISKTTQKQLVSIATAFGDASIISRIKGLGQDAETQRAIHELRAVIKRLEDIGLKDQLGVDLGELRGQAYYTGVSFTVLADGPGEPIGTGGRYDHLLERFGAPAVATGFALDIDSLEWALRSAGVKFSSQRSVRALLIGENAPNMQAWISKLRQQGITIANMGPMNRREALAYAAAWGYDHVLALGNQSLQIHRAADKATHTWNVPDDQTFEELVAFVTSGH